jgi:hypothetical protein
MSTWNCPHEIDGVCQLVRGAICDPGMRGCTLHGRYVFAKDEKGARRKPVLSPVEGPVLSSVEGPVLSPVEWPADPDTPPAAPPKRRLPF